MCDKDFAELSGELSGAICLKTLALFGSALGSKNSLVLFVRFFGLEVLFWPLTIWTFLIVDNNFCTFPLVFALCLDGGKNALVIGF